MLQTATIPTEQTLIFASLLGLAILLSLRRLPYHSPILNLTPEHTASLKGLAILTVVLGHIGYFLFTDHSFLYPLSTLSGVGVDLFLIISGYGLTMSALGKPLMSPWQFYKRRLSKIFMPLYLTMIIFLLLDFFLLHKTYDFITIIQTALGFVANADIYQDFNSSLWYLTPILFYYLIFPWIFHKRHYYLSILGAFISSYIFMNYLPLPVTPVVKHLYSLHYLAFPFGMLCGVIHEKNLIKIKFPNKLFFHACRYLAVLLSIIFIYQFSKPPFDNNILLYQINSLILAICFINITRLSKLRFRLLELFGQYSYEIYLLHWPLLYRYDLLYQYLPPALATILWLILLLSFGWLLHAFGDMIRIRRRTQTK